MKMSDLVYRRHHLRRRLFYSNILAREVFSILMVVVSVLAPATWLIMVVVYIENPNREMFNPLNYFGAVKKCSHKV